MSRRSRRLSLSGIYHVMLRGNNKQRIFRNDVDYQKFLEVLQITKELSGYKLLAYCLMPNHVHLLIKVEGEPPERIFKRIGARFVTWYNKKYERVGHLFQGRYRSEPVEDERYFLTVLRYIIQNPMKAGLEKRPGSYRWSSYFAYKNVTDGLTDVEFALEVLGSREKILAFFCEENQDDVMDMTEYRGGVTDDYARVVMKNVTECSSADEFLQLDWYQRRTYIRRMKEQQLGVRQIARLTGIGRDTIRRYLAEPDGKG